jgi:hypothetical protein
MGKLWLAHHLVADVPAMGEAADGSSDQRISPFTSSYLLYHSPPQAPPSQQKGERPSQAFSFTSRMIFHCHSCYLLRIGF